MLVVMTRLDEVKTSIEDDLTPFRLSEIVFFGSTQDMALNIKMSPASSVTYVSLNVMFLLVFDRHTIYTHTPTKIGARIHIKRLLYQKVSIF